MWEFIKSIIAFLFVFFLSWCFGADLTQRGEVLGFTVIMAAWAAVFVNIFPKGV